MRSVRRSERGITYVEMIATAAMIMILAAAIAPTARRTVKIRKEMELRQALREVRTALDKYFAYCDPASVSPDSSQPPKKVAPCLETRGPAKFEDLWEGVPYVGDVRPENKLRLLRRKPYDPMTNSSEWVVCCYRDGADCDSWCGNDVWDIHSKSTVKGTNGIAYNKW